MASKRLYVSVAALLLWGGVASGCATQSEAEPTEVLVSTPESTQVEEEAREREIVANAILLHNEQAIETAFGAGVTARLYTFEAERGDIVSVHMDSADEDDLDPYLALLGSNGEVISLNDNGEEGRDAAIVGLEIPRSGSYYLLASARAFMTGPQAGTPMEGEAPYTLIAAGMTTPPSTTDASDSAANDSATEGIVRTEIEVGQELQLSNTPERPVSYVTFEAEEGQVLTIRLTSDTFDALLYLFGPDGDRIAANDDGPEGLNSILENLTIPETGEYTLFATTYGFLTDEPYFEDENIFVVSVIDATTQQTPTDEEEAAEDTPEEGTDEESTPETEATEEE